MRRYRPAPWGAPTLFPTTWFPTTWFPTTVFLTLTLATLGLAATCGDAAPCAHEVVAARAALGPSAPQSLAAQLHRQPTVASVAAAERRLVAAFGCAAGKPRGRRRLH